MKDIIVYTSDTCAHCYSIKKFLDSRCISYVEKNVSVDSDAKKELFKLGFMSVPVVIINGEITHNPDKAKLQKLIGW